MEQQFIDWLTRYLPKSPAGGGGIGDDAAVLPWRHGGDLVVTTDTLTDHVDFRLEETDPQLIGHKALGVNLSDLAAMAAQPVAAFISLVLPRGGDVNRDAYELAIELYRGMIPLAERFDVAIAGGDTNSWDGPLVISVTALGCTTLHGSLKRSGAKPGDRVLVTGQFGGTILGRHLRVEPRVRQSLLLNERYALHAGMDVSDGLALDASRLAAASSCGIVLRLDSIPISPDAERLAQKSGRTPLEHALGDGEDFELLLTAAPDAAEQIVRDQSLDIPVTDIGECIVEPGLWQIDASDERTPLAPTGFQH